MTYMQRKRMKLIALAVGILCLWLYLLFAMNSCAAAPTHKETCDSFVGKDYYDIDGELGIMIFTDFKGDDMIRAYKKKDCTTFLHIDRKNIITSYETKGKCE
jgi:hypothetical protein